jgi:hypothetical protein
LSPLYLRDLYYKKKVSREAFILFPVDNFSNPLFDLNLLFWTNLALLNNDFNKKNEWNGRVNAKIGLK